MSVRMVSIGSRRKRKNAIPFRPTTCSSVSIPWDAEIL